MTGDAKVVGSSPVAEARRGRWLRVRDALGGALLLAAWIALWTATWAAVAGPLRPAAAVRADAADAAEQVARR